MELSCSTLCDPIVYQRARLLCPPLSLRVRWNLCPSSWWCYLTISSFANPSSFGLPSFPAAESFLVSWLFASGRQSIGASASASVLPVNIQGWSPLGWTGLISFSPRDSEEFSPTRQFESPFSTQPSLWSGSHIHSWLQEKPQLWLDGPLLAT